jgi:hypothetical protein
MLSFELCHWYVTPDPTEDIPENDNENGAEGQTGFAVDVVIPGAGVPEHGVAGIRSNPKSTNPVFAVPCAAV